MSNVDTAEGGNDTALRFAEEIMLLLLHDHEGKFARVPGWSLDYALAGGVLMDLALLNRIDTDLTHLILIDDAPTGDPLLGHNACRYRQVGRTVAMPGFGWSARRAMPRDIRESALGRLIERGILERRDDRFLWVFRSRRYPIVDGRAEREVKLRIMGVLFSDDIPEPRTS